MQPHVLDLGLCDRLNAVAPAFPVEIVKAPLPFGPELRAHQGPQPVPISCIPRRLDIEEQLCSLGVNGLAVERRVVLRGHRCRRLHPPLTLVNPVAPREHEHARVEKRTGDDHQHGDHQGQDEARADAARAPAATAVIAATAAEAPAAEAAASAAAAATEPGATAPTQRQRGRGTDQGHDDRRNRSRGRTNPSQLLRNGCEVDVDSEDAPRARAPGRSC